MVLNDVREGEFNTPSSLAKLTQAVTVLKAELPHKTFPKRPTAVHHHQSDAVWQDLRADSEKCHRCFGGNAADWGDPALYRILGFSETLKEINLSH